MWKLGRRGDLLPSADGKLRGVSVKVISKTGRVTILRRPIQHIYPLEVHTESTDEEADVNINDQDEVESVQIERRQMPRRVAAQNVRAVIRVLSEDD